MKMTRFFMQRPLLFWSLMVAILVAGVLSFIQMPKLEDPAISLKQAMVVVPWPGASAHDMELKVAQTIKDTVYIHHIIDHNGSITPLRQP